MITAFRQRKWALARFRHRERKKRPTPIWRVILASLLIASVVAGAAGAAQYVVTFWRYRGFPAPSAPKTVFVRFPGGRRKVRVQPADVVHITVRGPSLGEWEDPVYVILPPGYASHPWIHYPVLYLLHGTPGEPTNFILAGDLLPTYEVLLAEQRIRPMIIVLPSGAKHFFSDTEWANGILPGNGWETFVAQTLVHAIDERFRTIPKGSERGIGGLSEGGYGALNIGFHHLNDFSILESWSGYEHASDVTAVFGNRRTLMRQNSPAVELPKLASELRSRHIYVWFYIGSNDSHSLIEENAKFSNELARFGVAHSFETLPGYHSWRVWRKMMAAALIVASKHFHHG